MTVVAVTMVRDEEDIIADTVGQMVSQVDHVIVADNGSTDGTRDILETLGVEILDDPEPGYYQSDKMTRLAAYAAAEYKATFVCPFDADEWWYSSWGTVREVLENHEGAVATVDIYDHRATAEDPAGSPVQAMGWRHRDPLTLHKVACRPVLPVTITQGNHGAHYPTQGPLQGALVARHYPIRSLAQMIRKARNGGAAYAATDLPPDVGAHWRGWNRLSDEQLADVFYKFYFWPEPKTDPRMMFDPAPVPTAA